MQINLLSTKNDKMYTRQLIPIWTNQLITSFAYDSLAVCHSILFSLKSFGNLNISLYHKALIVFGRVTTA
jgi:hypothetical protein